MEARAKQQRCILNICLKFNNIFSQAGGSKFKMFMNVKFVFTLSITQLVQ